jgi:hypothetical protein
MTNTRERKQCCKEYDEEYDEVRTEGGKHYAKAVCSHCGHFLKWLPNPEITSQCEERNEKIDKFLRKNKEILKESQKKFLTDIKERRFLTPRQHEYLKNIFDIPKKTK